MTLQIVTPADPKTGAVSLTSSVEHTSQVTDLCQRTLCAAATITGIGLHSGAPVTMTLIPAKPGFGIVFRRTDLEGDNEIPALWNHVADTRLCSVLANAAGASVGTVEHLMAALAGCGIDNVLVELNGPEVPVMDGSSQPFVELISNAGVAAQPARRRVIRILKSVDAEIGDARAQLTPAGVFEVNMDIDFQSRAIAKQSVRLGMVNGAFSKELAEARTFGFLHEVEAMRAAGLARGGSLDNAVVIDGDEIVNEEGLRFDDEFVRHKALDAVGDLYLAGAQIIGAYHGQKAGHAVNNALLKALFADESAWCWAELGADARDMVVDGGIQAA